MSAYLEEEPDDEDLQSSHANDKTNLDHAEVDNSLLGTVDRAEISVLAGSEVLLVSRNGRELARDLEDRLFQNRSLLRA